VAFSSSKQLCTLIDSEHKGKSCDNNTKKKKQISKERKTKSITKIKITKTKKIKCSTNERTKLTIHKNKTQENFIFIESKYLLQITVIYYNIKILS